MISPKTKKAKKKGEPSEVDVHSPKSKKSKKRSHPKMALFLLKPKFKKIKGGL